MPLKNISETYAHAPSLLILAQATSTASARSVYLGRHKKSQRKACIDSRMLSTYVASPCQTLRDQPIKAHAQFVEGLRRFSMLLACQGAKRCAHARVFELFSSLLPMSRPWTSQYTQTPLHNNSLAWRRFWRWQRPAPLAKCVEREE